jgi:sulfoxide reductase catalytic subunit YedY
VLIKRPRNWELPEQVATPESVFRNRRSLLKIGAVGAAAVAAVPLLGLFRHSPPPAAPMVDPSERLYPAKFNDHYKLDRPVTAERYSTTYNNFYEFGSDKDIQDDAQALMIRPWQIKIDGLVESERLLDIDDLLNKVQLEERLYRHRCVEAWSMAVPWTGFPLKALVDIAKPLLAARYVCMETFLDPQVAPGQHGFFYPWPYVEGLTMAEATNDLAFLVTGMYGRPVPRQDGAPLRLAITWKYGFKSIKSIVRFSFVEQRPMSFWQALQGSEYGFWANVNPAVPHPRWSQATERILGADERRPTLLFNGYAEQVAGLYTDIKGERLYT